MNRKFKLTVIITCSVFLAAWGSPFSDEVKQGNEAFAGKKYSDAIAHYKNAEKHADDNKKISILNFNMGDAEYALGNYDRAVELYKKSASLGDKEIAKKSWFNMGNACLKSGKKKEAADAYSKALELDPEYASARKNLEYLLKNNDSKQNNENKDKDKNGNGQNGMKGDDSGKGENRSGKQELTPEQMKRILESMKNRPVRKQKGDGNGKKQLDKNW